MAKTYNSIPTVSTGDVYTATAHNNIVTNVNNYRVPPLAKISRAAALNHTNNGNWQDIVMDTFFESDSDMVDLAADSNRITITTAGVYVVQAAAGFQSNGTGNRAIRILKNGSEAGGYMEIPASASAAIHVQAQSLMSLVATDYIEVQSYQNSGGNLAYNFPNEGRVFLSVAWVGQVS